MTSSCRQPDHPGRARPGGERGHRGRQARLVGEADSDFHRESGRALLAQAEAAGLLVGVAPDTVLGPGVQTARRLIEDGETGDIIGGVSTVLSRGMEHWHPNPVFYYQNGAGPVLDLGPYHVAALTTLLGPVKTVRATGRIGSAERTVTADGPMQGKSFKVETLTTVNALLSFVSGAEITFLASWDVWSHGMRPIELYGEKASLRVPDPDFFGGFVELSGTDGTWREFDTAGMPLGAINYPAAEPLLANYRGIGLADMARAIETGVPHRCSGRFALHALAVMNGILDFGRLRTCRRDRDRGRAPSALRRGRRGGAHQTRNAVMIRFGMHSSLWTDTWTREAAERLLP